MEYIVIEKFILRSDVIIADQTIPLYDMEAFASLQTQFVDEFPPQDAIQIADIPHCDGAMHVKGYSMYPLLIPGDVVLYKIVPNRRGGLCFGKMYLLAFDLDGEECVTIKYLFQSDQPGCYRLESHNPEFLPRDVPIDRVRTLAIVKATLRYAAL